MLVDTNSKTGKDSGHAGTDLPKAPALWTQRSIRGDCLPELRVSGNGSVLREGVWRVESRSWNHSWSNIESAKINTCEMDEIGRVADQFRTTTAGLSSAQEARAGDL